MIAGNPNPTVISFLAPPTATGQGQNVGDGLLPSALITIVERLRGLPPGHHLMLHPISFAAYIGLFITAVNLFPAGQLDGGHIAYALLGQRSNILAYITVLVLLLLLRASLPPFWYVQSLLASLLLDGRIAALHVVAGGIVDMAVLLVLAFDAQVTVI